MFPLQALRWKARFAVLYAVGSWSLLGCVLYYKWSHRGERLPPDEERTLPREIPADAFFTSTITYKQNAAHPISDLYDTVKSFFATSDGPGPEE
ncbi:small integral membrane protein 26 [Gopherus flavomarginatus]|uniref:small integral membrane protein 26 n=1 Tax=Gopherus flavomarginatus TaxID=286002 RepID=UPI0021CC0B57|nr:small integral membrane protein 26 [Gopherus flavomarginatus]